MLSYLNLNAAGVDIGATEIYIAVPGDRDPQPVRCFSTFTEDLHAAADWLKKNPMKPLTTVAIGPTPTPPSIRPPAGLRR